MQIERNRKIGEGAFGEVWEGTLNLGVFRGHIPVAIKTLHPGQISADERIKFLREANLMLKLNHPNIIKFYGVATAKDPIMIVMELASGGTLLMRVQDTKHPVTFFCFEQQLAKIDLYNFPQNFFMKVSAVIFN